eukprot:TRINITY_DN6129_c0_g1_i12.p2 TRINITY_DN6129_c0_g1~~TRINITY_DN6129_c0_g1_i12.p2  ORF type:complete len:210 (+),score=56.44 TRINITY_DN6129_c0_g1_i12:148-777(+)
MCIRDRFNQFWDTKMQEFDEKATQIEEETITRQEEELQKFEEELEESLPQKPKDSAELLNHRKIEEQLAKQKDYIEAHKVQQLCLQMETEEYEKWTGQRRQKIRNQLLQLKQKQDNELNALRQRIVSGQDEQRKVRSLELERLLQKYQNVKKELEAQQQNEMIRLQKALANPGMGESKYSAMNSSKYQSNNTSRMSESRQKRKEEVNES